MMFILEYLRMVSYAIVILASLNGIAKKMFNPVLFFGDILMALVLLITGMLAKFANIPREVTRDCVLTPAAILWAVIHFMNLLKPVDKETILKS